MVTDGLGNPLRFLLSRGNRSDIGMAQELLNPFDLSGKLVLADKGYDSDKLSDWIKDRGRMAIIPSRRSSRHPRKIDWHVYKERHLIKNLFLKLKNHRRFSTQYEKGLPFSCCCFTFLSSSLVTLIGLKQALDRGWTYFLPNKEDL